MTEDMMTEEMLASLNPIFVTPAAVFLVSKDAPNRTVMFAGAGSYSKLEIRESKGLYIPEAERNADTIAAHFDQIADMSDPNVYVSGTEHVSKILTNARKA